MFIYKIAGLVDLFEVYVYIQVTSIFVYIQETLIL